MSRGFALSLSPIRQRVTQRGTQSSSSNTFFFSSTFPLIISKITAGNDLKLRAQNFFGLPSGCSSIWADRTSPWGGSSTNVLIFRARSEAPFTSSSGCDATRRWKDVSKY